MKTQLVKLKFTSPFHLNPPRDSLEKTETVIQSDMLISALAVCHSKLYGEFCDDFFSSKLRVSSLFPFYNNTLFLPVPLFDFWQENIDCDRKLYKKLKKVRYLEESLWQKVIAGERMTADTVHVSGIFGVGEENVEDFSEFFQEEEIQRLGQDPFYFSQVRMKENGGLFFFYQAAPEIEPKLKASLRLLGDEGLGSDKTVGKGLFEVMEKQDENKSGFQFSEIGNSFSHIMSLSFFIPSENDIKNIALKESYYLLQHKRGWYNTYRLLSLRKKGIFGFTEGSVFKTGEMPTGKKVTLLTKEEMQNIIKKGPVFNVLRSGFLLAVPVTVPVENSVEEVMNG